MEIGGRGRGQMMWVRARGEPLDLTHHLDERREKQWVGENGGRGSVGGGEIRGRGA